MKSPLSQLVPSQINDEIYTRSDLSDLKQSLETNGQLEPLVINKNNEIISGHRRYFSMVQLGWQDCNVRIEEYENDTIALIEHNRHRTKSVSDIVNESRILEKELKEQFGGKGKRNDLNGKGKFVVAEELSNRLGLGLSKMKQIKTISNYEPSLIQDIDGGKLSVNKAYEIVKQKYFKPNKIKTDKSDFSKKFKKLLADHEPSQKEIFEVLKSTHPYSLVNFWTASTINSDKNTLVETNPKLKKNDLN